MIKVLIELTLTGAFGAACYWLGRTRSMKKVLTWLRANEPGAFKRLSADIMGEPSPLTPPPRRVAGQRRRRAQS
ncbi:hypothetical protein BA895_21540 [Humibacillus sp. DSM 29435]|uniref:hypothetical protein n=1 Tax=Humibacillus sp. DSM 29435 TaxID=1869167 RepID=UPI0008730673|nr:hypothetical protein [Humibacillus sp. DSM 29435]OFE15708.1 hypothetical protein BA895_21540 [Humibacillus sp. DSM 29435]